MTAEHAAYRIAMDALELLTGSVRDDDLAGPSTIKMLSKTSSDVRGLLGLTTGMTALARLLIGMRFDETGAGAEQTLRELKCQLNELLPEHR
jgi:hypothetical protein